MTSSQKLEWKLSLRNTKEGKGIRCFFLYIEKYILNDQTEVWWFLIKAEPPAPLLPSVQNFHTANPEWQTGEFNISSRLGPTDLLGIEKWKNSQKASSPSIKLINILIREHVCLGWLSKMGRITICWFQEEAGAACYQQGILSPQSGNFNSLDNIFRQRVFSIRRLELNGEMPGNWNFCWTDLRIVCIY